jgi:hypothetical protein
MTGLLRGVDQLVDLLLALAKRLLQMAEKLLFLTLGEVKVIIGEFRELLPELAFQLMPFTFELELIHDQVRKGVGSMPEHMERPDRCECMSFRLSRRSSSPSLWACSWYVIDVDMLHINVTIKANHC